MLLAFHEHNYHSGILRAMPITRALAHIHLHYLYNYMICVLCTTMYATWNCLVQRVTTETALKTWIMRGNGRLGMQLEYNGSGLHNSLQRLIAFVDLVKDVNNVVVGNTCLTSSVSTQVQHQHTLSSHLNCMLSLHFYNQVE